jgi:hypothetical protein
MRLRQIALASRQLDKVTDEFEAVFGLKIAYRDPGVGHYGLRNAVMPAGRSFIEVVEPIQENTSAGRFLDKWGHDAGYMVILQTADAPAETARAVKHGVRVVDTIDRADYYAAHFHPADFGGVLVSFDQQRNEPDFTTDYGAWMPAGPDWHSARTDKVLDLQAATLTAADPEALAKKWSALIGRPLDDADRLRLPLDMGDILLRQGEPDSRTAFSGVTLKMADPQSAWTKARDLGLPVSDEGILIGGVHFLPAP